MSPSIKINRNKRQYDENVIAQAVASMKTGMHYTYYFCI